MATSKKIQERRNAIAEIISMRSNVPATVEEVATELLSHECMSDYRSSSEPSAGIEKNGKIDLKLIRLVQRDLIELEKDKLVECHGAFEIDMNGDRKVVSRPTKDNKQQPKALLWRTGPAMQPDTDDLDNLTSSVALQAIFALMGTAIPGAVREELEGARMRMASKIKKMSHSDPTVRWLNALVVMDTHHPFDRPIVDEDVRDTIEKAILDRKKVRLVVSDDTQNVEGIVVSISHFMFMPPDVTRVVCWEENTEKLISEGQMSFPSQIGLEKIERAELLQEPASWPKQYNPVTTTPEHEWKFDEVLDTFDLRVSPRLMENWKGKWIETQLEFIGRDDQGWTVCRFHNHLSHADSTGMLRYFFEAGEHIEVLAPYVRRSLMRYRIEKIAKMYSDAQEIPEAQNKQLNMDWFKRIIKSNRRTTLG